MLSLDFPKRIINRDELVKKELIGKGRYSQVYAAEWNRWGVAIKTLKINCLEQSHQSELENCLYVNHPHIVQIYGIYHSVSKIGIVMEKMNRSLETDLEARRGKERFELDQIGHITKKLVDVLVSLHSLEIIHNHLTPSNIFINGADEIKLSDFGMDKIKMNCKKNDVLDAAIRYSPAERFQYGIEKSKPDDVFSVGMIIWEMFANKKPFADLTTEQELISFISKGNLEEIPTDCPKHWTHLIKKCWNPNPMFRPTMNEISKELKRITADPGATPVPNEPAVKEPGNENTYRIVIKDGEAQIYLEPAGNSGTLPENCIIS